MKFFAHHKISFVDYPGKIATLLFVSGCNLNCRYCYNPILKTKREHTITEEKILHFLEKRVNKIDAIVITGGEPSLYEEELKNFFRKLELKFPYLLKKIDTNGTNPNFIENMAEYVDFISMDFKTLYYEKFLGVPIKTILSSIEKIKKLPDYEIRITVYPEYISVNDFQEIANLLKGVKNIVVQQYRSINNIKPYSKEILNEFQNILSQYAENVSIRGL